MKKTYAMAIMAFLLVSGGVMAQPSVEAPTEGSGTAENPWQIASVGNLLWIGDANEQSSPPLSERLAAYYLQKEDITFPENINTWDENKGWNPIGGGGTDHLFTGQYDGGGKSIIGLYINRPTTANVGLFGHLG